MPRVAAKILVKELAKQGMTVAAAESCTAGLATDFIAGIPGASLVFWGSFVAYTPEAKIKMLGVNRELLRNHGAVSRSVALAMAEGALKKSGASLAFSITGLAGPGGDGSNIPVGTVWIGLAGWDKNRKNTLWSKAKMVFLKGSRNELRKAAASAALNELLEELSKDIGDS